MSKNAIISVVVIIILIGLGVWYFSSMNGNSSYAPQTDTSTTDNTSGSTTTGVKNTNTFHSIFTQTGNHQCTYAQVGGTTSLGTSVVDIADGQMYGEFRSINASGNTVADLMIYNGGYLYAWKEGATVGTKTSIKTLADLPQVIPTDLTSGAIFGGSSDNVSWDCHDWAKDPKVFVIPTYVRFTAR